MKKIIVALLLFCAAGSLFAQRRTTIKMASPVPENSPWGAFLNQMSSDWRRITNGEVELVVYHNGVAGNEKDVVRNLKINQIQAAVLSTLALYDISPEIMTLSCPFLIRTDDELDLVLNSLKGELEDKINEKGFYTLTWARVGWFKFFSKAPVFTPADLKRQKVGTNADQAELNQIFKTMGFQMVPVARNDLLIALNSGMAEAIFNSPIAIGSMQAFGLAKNMASINISPFLGAIVFNQRSWRSIPDKYKPQLIESVRKNEAELDRIVREFEANMISTMGQYGLVVNQLSPAQEQLWYDEIGQAMPHLVGTYFDRGVYNRIQTMLQDYRNRRN